MVTNRHVVDDAETVEVSMNTLDGRTEQLTGTVLGRGILADLAVVQLPEDRTYFMLSLADSDDVSGADEVTAWGYTAGSISGTYPTTTRGVISIQGHLRRCELSANRCGHQPRQQRWPTDRPVRPGRGGQHAEDCTRNDR